ncbi:protein FAM185A-like [Physella acuta]|uniref:protein FAM185A-like n=1 Tax=Physella acuta TaxID=109671 RepID=UPI0027DD6FB6|nr:protein FAM185A-like [Physella acuta]
MLHLMKVGPCQQILRKTALLVSGCTRHVHCSKHFSTVFKRLDNTSLRYHSASVYGGGILNKLRKVLSHKHFLRSVFTSQQTGTPGPTQLTDKVFSAKTLIETWYYEVCPYGEMNVTLPFKTFIKPHDQPGLNKVNIQFHYYSEGQEEAPESQKLSHIGDLYDLDVRFDEDKANMNITCDITKGVTLPVVCLLRVPLQLDLKIKMLDDKDVSIENMDSSKIVIETERGNCFLKNIKCGSVSAVCRSGNITCLSTLLGNTYFHTGKSGSITTERLQGSSITCETEMGFINVRSLYADDATFRSDAGNFHLGHCHGQLYLLAGQSDINIESLDGDMDIGLQSGNVSAHLSRHQKANIEVATGDITLSFPEGANTDLNLDCQALRVDHAIDLHFSDSDLPHHKEGYIGRQGQALLNARTVSGTISLKQLDWISATKLFS